MERNNTTETWKYIFAWVKYLSSAAIDFAQQVDNEKDATVIKGGISVFQKLIYRSSYSISISEMFVVKKLSKWWNIWKFVGDVGE